MGSQVGRRRKRITILLRDSPERMNREEESER